MTPKFFTQVEGGAWFVWRHGPLKNPSEDLDQRAHTVWVEGETGKELVHSLAFGEMQVIQGELVQPEARWDSWNGWTRKLPDALR